MEPESNRDQACGAVMPPRMCFQVPTGGDSVRVERAEHVTRRGFGPKVSGARESIAQVLLSQHLEGERKWRWGFRRPGRRTVIDDDDLDQVSRICLLAETQQRPVQLFRVLVIRENDRDAESWLPCAEFRHVEQVPPVARHSDRAAR